ncbi:predicted protein [Streptomyces viridosporus ATCC 14672]|uniref:Predicted protein n=1 Tax=Streptomyces viridosporus (strain ATCC 14672 / DSM 40746 / JCM 4963 / KCTC 9882 / NRRL B-12104 / FH 1290) TaxID=566461 RepID=D5ZNS9_STRV1|nr:predicted protein [Streptomyces viridosporus ATCC 14672]
MLTLAVKRPVRAAPDRPLRLRQLMAIPADEPFGNRSR